MGEHSGLIHEFEDSCGRKKQGYEVFEEKRLPETVGEHEEKQ